MPENPYATPLLPNNALRKYWHFLLGGHFNMYTNHSVLKSLVNKLVLWGRICRWILLFQEYGFQVIVKSGCLNLGMDHLSWIEIGKEPTNLEEGLPNAKCFVVCVMDRHFEDINYFPTTWTTPKEYSVQKKKEMVVRATKFLSLRGTSTRWAMMRYCKDTYLTLNEVRSLWKHMGVLEEETIKDERLHQRFFAQGYGGLPCIRIRKGTVRPTIYVKGLENYHEGTRCH